MSLKKLPPQEQVDFVEKSLARKYYEIMKCDCTSPIQCDGKCAAISNHIMGFVWEGKDGEPLHIAIFDLLIRMGAIEVDIIQS